MDEELRAYGQFVQQNDPKRAATIELLLRARRRTLEALSREELIRIADEQFRFEVDLTQVIYLGPNQPTREDLIEAFLSTYKARLIGLDLLKLSNLLKFDE